jgi:hypothetical protein
MVWQLGLVPSFDLTLRATSAFCLPPNEMLRLQPGLESVVEADFIDYVTDYEDLRTAPARMSCPRRSGRSE